MSGHRIDGKALACAVVLAVAGIARGEPPQDSAGVIAVARQLLAEQASMVKRLARVAGDEDELPEQRQNALLLLGATRTRPAIMALLDNLLVPAGAVSTLSPLMNYPAASALCDVGSAAYPEIWTRVARECPDRYLYVLAHTVFWLDGGPVARARLREKLASPDTTRLQRTNIERILSIIETGNLTDPKNYP